MEHPQPSEEAIADLQKVRPGTSREDAIDALKIGKMLTSMKFLRKPKDRKGDGRGG